MGAISAILEAMMENELGETQAYLISHHHVESPNRIDVASDETVFISRISMQASVDFWLEFHSATESRLIEKKVSSPENVINETITRHKGSIYFSRSAPFDYQVSYVKLKIVK